MIISCVEGVFMHIIILYFNRIFSKLININHFMFLYFKENLKAFRHFKKTSKSKYKTSRFFFPKRSSEVIVGKLPNTN